MSLLVARTAARALSLGKNPHEWARRAEKVEKLLAVIDRFDPPLTHEDVAGWSEETWDLAARNAGINPASEKTRAFVVAQMRLRFSGATSAGKTNQ